MSQQQHHDTVDQWQEFEEAADQLVEEANALVQEMQDDEFRAALEDKFPQLRAWPGKDKK